MEGVVLNRVGTLGTFFVLDRARVSDPQRHSHTQTWMKCLPPPSPPPPLLQGLCGLSVFIATIDMSQCWIVFLDSFFVYHNDFKVLCTGEGPKNFFFVFSLIV